MIANVPMFNMSVSLYRSELRTEDNLIEFLDSEACLHQILSKKGESYTFQTIPILSNR